MKLRRVFRPILLSAALYLAWQYRDIKVARAQSNGECITSFDTSNEYLCSSCCTKQKNANVVINTLNTDPGNKSSFNEYFDCGTNNGSCSGGGCGVTPYLIAMDDVTCCVANGGDCLADSDCCSGTCNGENKCANIY